MLLGKRPRPPMRRTTSMTEFSGDVLPDVDVDVAEQPADQEMTTTPQQNRQHNPQVQQRSQPRERTRAAALAAEVAYRRVAADGGGLFGAPVAGGGDWLGASYMTSMLSPRGDHRRNSGDFSALERGSFLRNCGLCKRRLGPGKDIFMYRGDIAFCSLECRQQQMKLDERKEKCALTSMKETSTVSTGSEQSSSDGTVAAA